MNRSRPMKVIQIILGSILILAAAVYSLLTAWVGISVGFGMSGGTDREFTMALALAVMLWVAGLALLRLGIRRTKPPTQTADSSPGPAPRT